MSGLSFLAFIAVIGLSMNFLDFGASKAVGRSFTSPPGTLIVSTQFENQPVPGVSVSIFKAFTAADKRQQPPTLLEQKFTDQDGKATFSISINGLETAYMVVESPSFIKHIGDVYVPSGNTYTKSITLKKPQDGGTVNTGILVFTFYDEKSLARLMPKVTFYSKNDPPQSPLVRYPGSDGVLSLTFQHEIRRVVIDGTPFYLGVFPSGILSGIQYDVELAGYEKISRGTTLTLGQITQSYTSLKSSANCQPITCPANSCGNIPDGCQGTLSCSCTGGKGCIGNICVTPCVKSTCSGLGIECGTADDGCQGTLSCGACTGNKECRAGRCVSSCRPKTCSELKVRCGATDNGCGAQIGCGECVGTGSGCCSAADTNCNGKIDGWEMFDALQGLTNTANLPHDIIPDILFNWITESCSGFYPIY